MDNVYTIDGLKKILYPVFNANPIDKAVLFGSYAKRNPTRISDVDILIDGGGMIKGIDFFGILEDIVNVLDIPVDLIEASQVIDGSRIHNEIAKTGVVIYERK